MRSIKAQKGIAMLETSIVLPVFLLLILAAIDILRFSYNASALKFAVTESARWGSLADSLSGLSSNRIILKNYVQETALKAGFNIDPVNITVCSLKTNICEDDENLTSGEPYMIKVAQPMAFLTFFGMTKIIYAEAAENLG